MDNYLIYGANESGMIGYQLLMVADKHIVGFIDKKKVIIKQELNLKYNVYENEKLVPLNVLNIIDKVLVCVGDPNTAVEIQKKLLKDEKYKNIYVETIFDDKYKDIYLKLMEYEKFKRTGPLFEDGWFKSKDEQKCIDNEGNPIPWFSYPCIEFLKNRINSSMKVFEYGSGNGTLWWSEKVNTVIACEHEKQWYELLQASIPKNVQLKHIPFQYGGAYSNEISKYKSEFDIIVIDGRDRVRCAQNSIYALKQDGVIIWDNSERVEYNEGLKILQKKGFKRLDFIGLIPIANHKTWSSILYKDNNCLGI